MTEQQDEILELASKNCVDIKKKRSGEQTDQYIIKYTHEEFLEEISTKLKRGWFIQKNRLFVYKNCGKIIHE